MRASLYRVSMLAVVGALVALTSTLTFPAAARAGATYSPGAGIDATGASDVTAALQGFLDGVPDGSTVSFAAAAKYRIEGTLRLAGRQNLTLVGNGATFFATTTGNRTRSQWQVEGGADIVFRTMVIKGANPRAGVGEEAYVSALEAQHAINAGNVRGLEIDRVTATDTYGDFVYLGKQFGGWVDGAYIHDSRFERNGRQGISITGARNVRVVNNYIGDTRRATFDIEPNGATWGADNVLIADNVVGPGRLLFIASAGSGPVSNVTVTRNVLHRALRVTVGASDGTRRQNFVITDNVSDVNWGRAGGSALTFKKVDGITVTGNVQRLQAGRGTVGVEAFDSCNVTIRGNSFPGGAGEATVAAYAGCAGVSSSPSATASASPSPTPTAKATTSPTPTAKATTTPPPSSAPTGPAPTPIPTITPGTSLWDLIGHGMDLGSIKVVGGAAYAAPIGQPGGDPAVAGPARQEALSAVAAASAAPGAGREGGATASSGASGQIGASGEVSANGGVGASAQVGEPATPAAVGPHSDRATSGGPGILPSVDVTSVPGALSAAGGGLALLSSAALMVRRTRLHPRSRGAHAAGSADSQTFLPGR